MVIICVYTYLLMGGLAALFIGRFCELSGIPDEPEGWDTLK